MRRVCDYNGWGERTSYYILDEEREQAIIIMDKEGEQPYLMDEDREQANIIVKINWWGKRTRNHNGYGAIIHNGWGERTSYYM